MRPIVLHKSRFVLASFDLDRIDQMPTSRPQRLSHRATTAPSPPLLPGSQNTATFPWESDATSVAIDRLQLHEGRVWNAQGRDGGVDLAGLSGGKDRLHPGRRGPTAVSSPTDCTSMTLCPTDRIPARAQRVGRICATGQPQPSMSRCIAAWPASMRRSISAGPSSA